MRERLRSYIEERTRILAAITHDLKTPLTRLRLRLEQCEDERLRARLAEDVAAMQTLVNEGLALARSLDSGQPLQTIDLGALLQSLCDDAVDAGWEVRFEGPYGALIAGRLEALRRSLLNLIDNAVKYGREAEVTLERSGENWQVLVRDRGPGIPERHLDDVMQPFFPPGNLALAGHRRHRPGSSDRRQSARRPGRHAESSQPAGRRTRSSGAVAGFAKPISMAGPPAQIPLTPPSPRGRGNANEPSSLWEEGSEGGAAGLG